MIKLGLYPIELPVKCPTCLKDSVVKVDQTHIEHYWISCVHCGPLGRRCYPVRS